MKLCLTITLFLTSFFTYANQSAKYFEKISIKIDQEGHHKYFLEDTHGRSKEIDFVTLKKVTGQMQFDAMNLVCSQKSRPETVAISTGFITYQWKTKNLCKNSALFYPKKKTRK